MQQELSCPNCGARVMEGQQFCGACGANFAGNVPPSAATCPGCGSAVSTDQRYCGVCGTQLTGMEQTQPKSAQPEPSAIPPSKTAEPEKATAADKEVKSETATATKTAVQGYGMLNFAVIIFRIVGWVLLIGGCLGSIAVIVFAIIGGGFQTLIPGLDTLIGDTAMWMGVGCLIFSFVYGLAFIAFGELCRAVVNIATSISAKK